MHFFEYKKGELCCEEVPLARIASQVGTPFYCYSTATLARHFRAFDEGLGSFPHLTCFAVKACSNIAILNLFAGLGGGADIVSGGELFRCLKAGVDPKRIIYSGVGKTRDELRYALEAGILLFNVESAQELEALQSIAAGLGLTAPVSFRINPDVDPKTHAYISTGLAKNKFGIPMEEAEELYIRASLMANVEVLGVSCHIGSQLTQIAPFVEALQKVKSFVESLGTQGIGIRYIDLGGGVGIRYRDEEPPDLKDYAAALTRELAGLNCTLILEPGRVIVGNAGVLVSSVLYTKRNRQKNFVVVDAAMNDLARPSLYGAFHDILPVRKRTGEEGEVADVVGPICESGDFLARDRELPVFAAGDLMAVMSAGAYGFTMSSNYNSRPRAAEVLVAGDRFHVIRGRETYNTLIQGESIPEAGAQGG